MDLSVPKLISPLLDGFIMGEPISDHDGVRCCPALREDTDERYIVKIVSIPATQDQLDALLLSGAFDNEQKALGYFKELADGVTEEASILSRLSKLEGFLPYRSSQIVKIPDRTGYDVYLLSPYRTSLDKQMRAEPLTHLAAVNLGLDMCAALAVCRRMGYIYADLRPENIFITDMRGYCIGDLGFIPVSSLKYASLPEKYRSAYTPPEITDAYSALNDSMDIYALGLVLYQVFNNGELPTDQPLPPPMYADYEMAAIILKACASDPDKRWKDPAQMGQALVDYLQRNEVNDTPIVPAPVEPVAPVEEEPEDFLSEEDNDRELAELLAMIPDEEPPEERPSQEEAADTDDASDAEQLSSEEASAEDTPADDTAPTEDACSETAETEGTSQAEDEDTAQSAADDLPNEEDPDAPDTDAPQEDTLQTDEELERADRTEEGLTTEVAEMLAQADELLQMQLPEPVVAPDPIDVPIPPPIVPEPEPGPEADPIQDVPPTVEEQPQKEQPQEPAEAAEEAAPEPIQELTAPLAPAPKKRKLGRWIGLGAVVALLVALAFGIWYYYQNIYLQTIDLLTIHGDKDQISITIQSDIDESLLTVVCTDTYGNTFRQSVTDGKVLFTGLRPNAQYMIHVEIAGMHQLQGQISATHTTEAQTLIQSFTATPGPDEGTVILNFSTSGPTSDSWLVEYSAPEIPSRTTYFTGTHVTLTDLTVGAEYTFQLRPKTDLYIAGTQQITFTPPHLPMAENIHVQSFQDGTLVLTWDESGYLEAEGWTVRCIGNDGSDHELTCTERTITIMGLDPWTAHEITITAKGTNISQTYSIEPKSIQITGYATAVTDPWTLELSWTTDGLSSTDHWIVHYTIDDGQSQETFQAEVTGCTAQILLRPGCTYTFSVAPAEDDILFQETEHTFQVEATAPYTQALPTSGTITAQLHQIAPGTEPNAGALSGAAPSQQIVSGESAALLLRTSGYEQPKDDITTTFVIRNGSNELISAETIVKDWDSMWHGGLCALSVPQLPTEPGSYTLDLYMRNANDPSGHGHVYITSISFTII